MILEKRPIKDENIFLSKVDYTYLPDSELFRIEVYLVENRTKQKLVKLFFSLFGEYIENFLIGQLPTNVEWGQFCMDTWDFENDKANYQSDSLSIETKQYLNILDDSKIEYDFSGFCVCSNWEKFLDPVLDCILSHKAPYSPLIYDFKNQFMFYFHHTYSLGIYYLNKNEVLEKIYSKIKNDNKLKIYIE